MRSIRVHLFALVGVCLLLAALAFGLVVLQARQISRQQAEAQARETSRALSLAVDRELERGQGILLALGASEAAERHDWAALDRQARAAFRDPHAWIVVHDRRGQQWVNTRLPVGARLPRTPPPLAMWREIAGGKPRVCNLVHGAIEPNIVCVDVPLKAGGTPEYAISMVINPERFGSILIREKIGGGNVATLVDRNGAVIWRNIRPLQFVGRPATGAMMKALASGAQSATLESKSLDGVDMLSAFRRSPMSGWAVIVGTPLSEIDMATNKAIRSGSLLALAVLALAAFLATAIGARLVSSINKLLIVSEQGDNGKPLHTGFREVDRVASALNASDAARRESQRHQQMLVGELNHRVKNTLAIVQSLAHQTFRKNASPDAAISAFEARLQALAAAHNLLTREKWDSASMLEVVKTAMGPFCSMDRCDIEGPDLRLLPQTAVSLALALHELATNASKYGALTTDAGKIVLRWSADDGHFTMSWEERGGPLVKPPQAEGFGMRLLKRSLAAEIRGTAEVEFAPEGLRARLAGRLSQG
ncbi:hypothetical protein G7077_00840 [Sphingomonas piscis]|uniref:histidine kinase n=1 Tax=Sphingomonas piscis TaxID=2714943 RepID=A0A6G7YLR9_9SPHN|nr:sensor histidine kinase [Sphingomonas piscis]QIK77677.1 hypothetical protein G7077_00840 [Sphingomonas piscis]